MSWETGGERIQELLRAGELGQVPPDTGLARRMLADAGRHLATAAAAESTGDLQHGGPRPIGRRRTGCDPSSP
jgi:hypothetical protein